MNDGGSNFVYVTYIYTTPQKVWDAITRPDFAKRYWFNYNVSTWNTGSRWEHDPAMASSIAGGWPKVLSNLKSLLETGNAENIWLTKGKEG